MKLSICNIEGSIIRDNEVYTVRDNTTLKNLVLSSTMLNPNQQTTGHSHQGQEEIYFFVSGKGAIQIGNDLFEAESGDVFLIEDGLFHKVFNKSDTEQLYFVCAFQGKRAH